MTRPRPSEHLLRWMIRAASEAGKPGREAPTVDPADLRENPAGEGTRTTRTETQENRSRA